MFFDDKQSLEDHVLEALKSGPIGLTGLIADIQNRRPGTTKQGVYRVVRVLKNREVIVVHRGEASLNLRWLNDLNNFTAVAQHHYIAHSNRPGHFSNLQEGEKISYTFNSLSLTDAFWNHVLYLLLEVTRPDDHWFAYNPHAWFFLARRGDELALRRRVNEKGRLYLLAVGGTTAMDRAIVEEVNGARAQYHRLARPLFPSSRYYVNIIGDFLVEVYVDEEISKHIEAWYQATSHATVAALTQLQDIIKKRGKTKLVISRHAKKATRLKTKLAKYFYFAN